MYRPPHLLLHHQFAVEAASMRSNYFYPIVAMRRLQDEVNRAFGGGLAPNDAADNDTLSAWWPAVDVHEEQDRYVLKVDVPGVEPSAIEVSLENGVLSISGERTAAGSNDKATGVRRERVTGKFYRRFALPDSADVEQVEARSVHGVLEVAIPKKVRDQVKKIKVAA
jgi:HSP20 family protein